jgi:hypothetical protein
VDASKAGADYDNLRFLHLFISFHWPTNISVARPA